MKILSVVLIVMFISCESKQYIDCHAIYKSKNNDTDYLTLKSQYNSLHGLSAMNSSFVKLDGSVKKIYEEKGNVIVINFWFIGCKPCMAEMPFFIEMKKKYEGKNVSFFSVAKNKKEELVSYVSNTKFNWPVYFADDVRHEYCVSSYPTTVILDKQMKVLHYAVGGSLEKEAIAANIDHLQSIIDSALIK